MPTMVLKPELETYERLRPDLVKSALGKWVLIKGDELVGTFDTQNDAIAEGYRHFGNVPFLVREVTAFDTPTYITSNFVTL
jgi:hypothetical protein